MCDTYRVASGGCEYECDRTNVFVLSRSEVFNRVGASAAAPFMTTAALAGASPTPPPPAGAGIESN